MFSRSLTKLALGSSTRQATAHSAKLPVVALSNGLSNTRATPSSQLLISRTLAGFHTSSTSLKGIFPDSSDPAPKSSSAGSPSNGTADNGVASELGAAVITTEEYHQLADLYLDDLVSKLETLQEAREDVDVEFGQGVLTLTFPPRGTYVINKQPPNKQIWLSSPISGPKRYDYVVTGDGQHEKEGGGQGEWVYLRDGSTLTELVKKEIGVEVGLDSPEV